MQHRSQEEIWTKRPHRTHSEPFRTIFFCFLVWQSFCRSLGLESDWTLQKVDFLSLKSFCSRFILMIRSLSCCTMHNIYWASAVSHWHYPVGHRDESPLYFTNEKIMLFALSFKRHISHYVLQHLVSSVCSSVVDCVAGFETNRYIVSGQQCVLESRGFVPLSFQPCAVICAC